MLEIFTKTTIKLFKVLLGNPLKEYKEIELVNLAKTGKGAANTLINSLIKSNMLNEKRIGKTKLLSLDLNNPATFSLKVIFDQEKVKDIPQKKLAAVFLLKNQIKGMCSSIILFGSTINKTFTKKSDIDLLIISENTSEIERERNSIEEITGEKFNPHIHKNINLQDSFFQNILTQGIIIHGYDYVKEFFKFGNKPLDRLYFLYNRLDSAKRNKNDYETSNEIIRLALEQLIFYLLSENKISYNSKKEAKNLITKLPEGKSITKIEKAELKEKILLFQGLLSELFQKKILLEESLC